LQLHNDICIGRTSRKVNLSHLDDEIFAAVVICHDVLISCAKLGPKIRATPTCLAHDSHLILCLGGSGIEPSITIEADVKAFVASFKLQVNEFRRCSAVLVINDSNQGFAEGVLVGEVQHFSFFGIPSKLPTLGRVVTHASIIGIVTKSHHPTLICVLVGSFTGVSQGQIVANFMNLSGRISAPVVIENSQPATQITFSRRIIDMVV
jgi:hypothetical protein